MMEDAEIMQEKLWPFSFSYKGGVSGVGVIYCIYYIQELDPLSFFHAILLEAIICR